MRTTVEVYVNADDALLRWAVDDLDDRCLGFAVQRRLNGGAPAWLDNFAPPGRAEHQRGVFLRSDEAHFRCFSWTDHGVDTGDTVSYRVLPVMSDAPAPREDLASEWSEPRTVRAGGDTPYAAHFNRGFVMSQFVSRYLDEHFPNVDRGQALRRLREELTADLENRMRVLLSGQLRTALLRLLDGVARGRGHVYAALFELTDRELITGLEALGPRAHLVLANGSVQARRGETTAQARRRDENATARAALVAAGVDVETTNRFVAPGALAHDKFLVVTTAAGRARRVWTGSTNWSPTGLCTQLNNAVTIDDASVAAAYLEQWRALRAAGSGHPPALTTANDQPTAVGADQPGTVHASVHFTRAHHRTDLRALDEIVNGARHGVLFLMFMPGAKGVLATVRGLAAARPDLLVRGVVSELPKGRADERTGPETTLRVTLFGTAADAPPAEHVEDVIQPAGMAHPAAGWAVEATRRQFQGNVGHAIIHSKVLVVDPFSEDPTVVTGSHNFSLSASEENDENFVVVRGDRALAEAYAVNVQSAWRHYAGRAANPHAELSGIDYLRALLADQRRERPFWQRPPAPAPVPAPTG
jgi:phosphatidylserine/phosphatidylglycerophosphate/cardiolipin synthase-like enzyme